MNERPGGVKPLGRFVACASEARRGAGIAALTEVSLANERQSVLGGERGQGAATHQTHRLPEVRVRPVHELAESDDDRQDGGSQQRLLPNPHRR